MKNLILIVTLFLTLHLYGQEMPLPINCFPLNGTNSEEIMSGQMADIHGKVHAWTDRFGAEGRAITFDGENSYISFPMVSTDEQMRREVTVTYWMYVGNDSIAQTFWAKDGDGNLLLGMKKKGARAVLDIYHKNSQQNVLPDQQWMWSDSNFSEGRGWYFVAIAYSEEGTRFYLGTPKGNMTECYSAFTPDWNSITSISIGAVDGIPTAGMDDFKVYGAALSKEQVSVLYQSESELGMGNESLLNVETNVPLYSSTWYLHCVGLQGTLKYVLQNQAGLSFVSADAGYALSTVLGVENDYQKWGLHLIKDTAKGRIFTIGNCATGMNLADTRESVLQQVSDNTDAQKWCIGQFDGEGQTRSTIKENNKVIPLYEEIYFDKNAGVVRIRINFPEAKNVKVKLTDVQGALLRELFSGNVQLLEKEIRPQANGVYLVTVEADNYRINRKVFVNN